MTAFEDGSLRKTRKSPPERQPLDKTDRPLTPTSGDESVARTFGAAENLVGRPSVTGSGAEKIHFRHADRETLVTIHKQRVVRGGASLRSKVEPVTLIEPDERKEFMRQKPLRSLINILYPESVSHMRRTAANFGVSLSKRVEGTRVATANRILARQRFRLRMEALGLEIDTLPGNFIQSDDHTLSYVDTLIEVRSVPEIAKRIEGMLSKRAQDPSTRQQAERLLKRYRSLR